MDGSTRTRRSALLRGSGSPRRSLRGCRCRGSRPGSWLSRSPSHRPRARPVDARLVAAVEDPLLGAPQDLGEVPPLDSGNRDRYHAHVRPPPSLRVGLVQWHAHCAPSTNVCPGRAAARKVGGVRAHDATVHLEDSARAGGGEELPSAGLMPVRHQCPGAGVWDASLALPECADREVDAEYVRSARARCCRSAAPRVRRCVSLIR